ncbi:MAG: class I SAM-dependent methyltransferase [Actinobacteria bacterium]|nr:MAG: class I SAM-dependent methyltransferase [Actinomycetota bacterium]RIK07628.1 MAG: hypothetical protein DCC48_03805 [Acidobacteriota bacterium]
MGPSDELPFAFHIDSPRSGQAVASTAVQIAGWVAMPSTERFEAPRLRVVSGAARELSLVRNDRPDVREVFPAHHVFGFNSLMHVSEVACGVDMVVIHEGDEYVVPVDVEVEEAVLREFDERKAAKLDRIEPLLACSACGSELGPRRDEVLICPGCGVRVERRDTCFDTLSEELRAEAGVVDTAHVSSHEYNRDVLEILDEHAEGLVLDAGCGFRTRYYPQVVNLEVVAYPTTDVLGIGERLPFVDESFEAVLSLNVLEHLRDPFAAAIELVRVTKRGGKIYAAVPFLQPYHGYPHHYFNMTREGLEGLFVDECEVIRSGVPKGGHPIASLRWFLDSYRRGLPAHTAERFTKLSVSDLLADPTEQRDEAYVRQLSAEAQVELASVNAVLAVRR